MAESARMAPPFEGAVASGRTEGCVPTWLTSDGMFHVPWDWFGRLDAEHGWEPISELDKLECLSMFSIIEVRPPAVTIEEPERKIIHVDAGLAVRDRRETVCDWHLDEDTVFTAMSMSWDMSPGGDWILVVSSDDPNDGQIVSSDGTVAVVAQEGES